MEYIPFSVYRTWLETHGPGALARPLFADYIPLSHSKRDVS